MTVNKCCTPVSWLGYRVQGTAMTLSIMKSPSSSVCSMAHGSKSAESPIYLAMHMVNGRAGTETTTTGSPQETSLRYDARSSM
jgi:hypothetical protein